MPLSHRVHLPLTGYTKYLLYVALVIPGHLVKADITGQSIAFTLADFILPADQPLIIPSKLLHGHPDILAAEALLYVVNAYYDVTIVNLGEDSA